MRVHCPKILLVLAGILVNSNALCQLHFTELKGLDTGIGLKPEYDYLNPLRGFALAKQLSECG